MSLFGQVTRARFSASGPGLGLIEHGDSAPYPSEVYKLDWRTGKNSTVFRDKRYVITDVWLTSQGTSYLAGIETAGQVRSIAPGNVKVFKSSDMTSWTEMAVDYRAVARRAMLSVKSVNITATPLPLRISWHSRSRTSSSAHSRASWFLPAFLYAIALANALLAADLSIMASPYPYLVYRAAVHGARCRYGVRLVVRVICLGLSVGRTGDAILAVALADRDRNDGQHLEGSATMACKVRPLGPAVFRSTYRAPGLKAGHAGHLAGTYAMMRSMSISLSGAYTSRNTRFNSLDINRSFTLRVCPMISICPSRFLNCEYQSIHP